MTILTWFEEGLKTIMQGNLDIAGDGISCALLDNSAVFDLSETFFDDILNSEELAEGEDGYNRLTITPTFAIDSVNDQLEIEGSGSSEFEWTNADFTARYAMFFQGGLAGSDDYLLFVIDFETDQSVASGTFKFSFGTSLIDVDY